MNQDMVILIKIICTLENNILLFGDEVFFKYQLEPIGWWYCSFLLYLCWFSVCAFYFWLIRKSTVINEDYFKTFPFSSFSFLLYDLKFSSYVDIHLGFLWLLGGFTFLSYVILHLIISGNFLYSKVHFHINISTLAFPLSIFVS